MLAPSSDCQQANIFLQMLAERMQEELNHPSPLIELGVSARLEDYCRLFFLRREYEAATKEQNKLLCHLATQQKIYIFNLKKMHAVITKTCSKIDQALAIFRPQMYIIEEFKKTAAKTRQLQADILYTIDQSLDTIAQIRVYTFIPSREGEPPNPLLALMEEEYEMLHSHLAYIQRIKQEDEQTSINLRQAFNLYHKQADEFLCLSQECEKDLQFIQQGTQALCLEGQRLREEGQELARDVQEFGKDVAKLRQEGQELAQDMKKLRQDTKVLSDRVTRLGQEVNEVTEGVKELRGWRKDFRNQIEFHMVEAKESRYLMDELQRKLALAEQLLNPPRPLERPASPLCDQTAKKQMVLLKAIISWAWHAPLHLRLVVVNKVRLIFLSCMRMFQPSTFWPFCFYKDRGIASKKWRYTSLFIDRL